MNPSEPLPANRERAALAAILLLASVRFLSLGQESFWLDEAKGALGAFSPYSSWIDELPRHQTPPGHFFLLSVASRFGKSETILRLPSAAAGVLAVWVLWRLGRREGAAVGLGAALLLAVSPSHFHFSREARPYAIWVLAELVSLGSLLAWRDRPERSRRGIAAGFLLPLPLLFHYHALWFLLGRIPLAYRVSKGAPTRSRSSFAWGVVVALACALPWAVNQALRLPPPNPRAVTAWDDLGLSFVARKLGEVFGFPYPWEWLAVVVLAPAVHGLARPRIEGGRRTGRSPAFAAAFPPAAIVIASLVSGRYIAARHFLPLVPLLLWPAARAVADLPRGYARRIGVGAGGLLTVFCAELCVRSFFTTDRPPWREIALYLEERATSLPSQEPGAVAFHAVGDNVKVLDFYRESLSLAVPLSSGSALPESASVAGVLVSGDEDGGAEWRERLSELGLKPGRIWTSRRISRIEFYTLPEEASLALRATEGVTGSR